MMNKKNILYYGILSSFLWAVSNVNASNIEKNTAHMQAMDKITGRVSEIDVPVNGVANFGTFSILVRKCVTKSPEEAPENTAFVDVVDNYKTTNPVNIFKGWMFSSTPALNAVEHPIYDLWLLECYDKKQNKNNLLSEDQLALRDEITMVRNNNIETETSLVKIEEAPEDVTLPVEKKDSADKNYLDNNEILGEEEDFVAEDDEVNNEMMVKEPQISELEAKKNNEENINNNEESKVDKVIQININSVEHTENQE